MKRFRLASAFTLMFVAVLSIGAVAQTVVTVGMPSGRLSTIGAAVKLYENEHPNVEIELVGITGNYYEQLPVMFAAGEAPDIVFLEDRYFRSYVEQGLLVSLDRYLTPEVIDIYFPPTLAPFEYKGERYGLPRRVNNVAVLYNLDLMDASGLPYPQDGWTQEEFLDYAKRLVRYGADGAIDVAGAHVSPPWERVLPWLWANGGGFFTEDYEAVVVDREVNRATLQFLADLIHEHRVQPASVNEAQAFSSNKLGMIAGQGAWLTLTLRENESLRWDVAPFPQGSAGRANIIYASALAMTSNASDRSAAADVLIWASGHEAQRAEATTPTAIPSIRDVALDVFLDSTKPPENMTVFLDELAYGRPVPQVRGIARMAGEMSAFLAEIFRQSAPTTNVLNNLQHVLQGILDEETALDSRL